MKISLFIYTFNAVYYSIPSQTLSFPTTKTGVWQGGNIYLILITKKGRTSKTFGCKTVYLKKNYGLKPEHENIHNFNLINSF